jgi:hypothetical protein
MSSAPIGLHAARVQVARAGVGPAAVLGLLGSVITFVPGAEVGWFGVAAADACSTTLAARLGCALVSSCNGSGHSRPIQGHRENQTLGGRLELRSAKITAAVVKQLKASVADVGIVR